MSNVPRQAIHIIYQNSIKDALRSMVAKPVKIWAGKDAAAPALVFIHTDDCPLLLGSEPFELLYLGFDGLAFALVLSGNPGIESDADVFDGWILHVMEVGLG